MSGGINIYKQGFYFNVFFFVFISPIPLWDVHLCCKEEQLCVSCGRGGMSLRHYWGCVCGGESSQKGWEKGGRDGKRAGMCAWSIGALQCRVCKSSAGRATQELCQEVGAPCEQQIATERWWSLQREVFCS